MRKTTKVMSIILSVLMLVSLFAVSVSASDKTVSVWDGSADTSWYNSEDPKTSYEIDSAAKLAGLAQITKTIASKDPGAFVGVTFYITKDIDLAGLQWTSIGDSNDHSFAGMLVGKLEGVEGAAVTISGLTMGTADAPTSAKNIGLVGTQSGGGAKNIKLVGATINTKSNTAGGFAGYVKVAACTYENLYSDVVINTAATQYAGGIVAYNNVAASFKNCVYVGSINATNSGFTCGGGITGSATKATTLENCYSSAKIVSAGKRTGGMVGNASANITFTDCQFDGSVSGTATQTGAMIGRFDCSAAGTSAEFTRCLNTGVSRTTVAALNENGDIARSISWIGLVANHSSKGTFTFTDCYSNMKMSFAPVNDFDASKVSNYTVTVNGTTATIDAPTSANALIDYKCPVVTLAEVSGDAAKTKLAGYTFSADKWATRDGKYPVLAIAAESAEGGDADMSWFDTAAGEFEIGDEAGLRGIAKIALACGYDFADKTCKAPEELKDTAVAVLGAEAAQRITFVKNPNTGDGMIAVYAVIAMVSLLGFATVAIVRRKVTD